MAEPTVNKPAIYPASARVATDIRSIDFEAKSPFLVMLSNSTDKSCAVRFARSESITITKRAS